MRETEREREREEFHSDVHKLRFRPDNSCLHRRSRKRGNLDLFSLWPNGGEVGEFIDIEIPIERKFITVREKICVFPPRKMEKLLAPKSIHDRKMTRIHAVFAQFVHIPNSFFFLFLFFAFRP